MSREILSSRHNPRIKTLLRLHDRRGRDQEGAFLIEGCRESGHALDAGVPLREAFFCPDLFSGPACAALLERLRAAGLPLYPLAPELFRQVSLREGPDGLLLVATPPTSARLARLALPPGALLLVVEAVEKPGNLGAILRTADGAGVSAVLCCDPVLDLWNPNVIRSSQGLVFALPVAAASTPDVLAWLRTAGVRLAATTPHQAHPLWDADLTGPLALVLGSEKDGLSPPWLHAADLRLRIPMAGRADSLNVAASAAIVLFEAARQRRNFPPRQT